VLLRKLSSFSSPNYIFHLIYDGIPDRDWGGERLSECVKEKYQEI